MIDKHISRDFQQCN